MNSYSAFQGQKDEFIQEEGAEALQNFLDKEREKAYKSYPEGAEVKYCSICSEPLRFNSMSYYEGYHFDSCL